MSTRANHEILNNAYTELHAVLMSYVPAPGGPPMGDAERLAVMTAVECVAAEALVYAWGLRDAGMFRVGGVIGQFSDRISDRVAEVRRALGAKS